MKQRYVVTKKLKKLLLWCCPNECMEEINQMEYITADGITENGPGCSVLISFVEIRGGYWSYSRKFFNELSKNQVLPKGVMEIE